MIAIRQQPVEHSPIKEYLLPIVTGVAVLGWLWLTGLSVLALADLPVRRHHFEAAGITFGCGLLALAFMCTTTSFTRPPVSRDLRSIVWLLPAVAGILAYAWCLRIGPLSDDFVLHRWATTKDWIPASWPYVRPLPLMMWSGLAAVGGNWTALHSLNLIFHGANSALVARIGFALGDHRTGLVAGMLFALFPASVEAVAWTAGVFDVLATFFTLSAVCIWTLRFSTPFTLVLLPILLVAGVLSKETAFAMPGLLLVAHLATRHATQPTSRTRWAGVALIVLASAVLLTMRAATSDVVQLHSRSVPTTRYEWKEMLVRPYIGGFVPFRRDIEVAGDIHVAALAVLALLGVALSALYARDKGSLRGIVTGRAILLGLTWIALSSWPLLLQFHVSSALEGSRYLYLPAAGVAFVVSASFASSSRRAPSLIATTAFGCLIAIFVMRIGQERQLWTHAATERDHLLSEVTAAALQNECRTIDVQGVPDNIRGVYVFRQGWREALARLPSRSDGAPCRWLWDRSRLTVR